MAEPKKKVVLHTAEQIEISLLKPHPKNYKHHGTEQLDHLVESMSEAGFYRNVVVAKDYTILAGHGVVEASKKLGLTAIPVVRLDVAPDDVVALKVIAGDNEIARLAEVNDRALTELLREIKLSDDLLGTGFDDLQLANLVFVTRPESEIKDFAAAAEWVGLPGYDQQDPHENAGITITILFETLEDRERFVAEKKLQIRDKRGDRRWNTVYPYKERNDLKSVKFEGGEV